MNTTVNFHNHSKIYPHFLHYPDLVGQIVLIFCNLSVICFSELYDLEFEKQTYKTVARYFIGKSVTKLLIQNMEKKYNLKIESVKYRVNITLTRCIKTYIS